MGDKDFFNEADTTAKITEALNESQQTEIQGEQAKSDEVQKEIEKIKVGDIEYSQEELSKYVGLGKLAEEIETKQNTKLDKVYPQLTKISQEKKDLEAQIERMKSGVTENGELDPNAIAQAREAAKKIGIVTDDQFADLLGKSFTTFYRNERMAERLIEDTDSLIKENTDKGLPKTTTEAILTHMRDNGFKTPDKAYKDMFEKEIDSWKEQQLVKAKKPGFITQVPTNTGGKQPLDVRPNKDNLYDLVSEALNQGNG